MTNDTITSLDQTHMQLLQRTRLRCQNGELRRTSDLQIEGMVIQAQETTNTECTLRMAHDLRNDLNLSSIHSSAELKLDQEIIILK